MITLTLPKPKRPKPDPMLPLINLSFLLLVFLLLVGVIEQSPVSTQDLPKALVTENKPEKQAAPFYVQLSLTGFMLDGAPIAAAAIASQAGALPITLLAPADLPAAVLTNSLQQLSAQGVSTVKLAVEHPAR